MKLLTETFAKEISFTLGCYDRIIIKGTIPEICHCQGMTSFMLRNKLRIFDYAKYVEQYKETLRQNAEKIAAENSLVIEFVRKSSLRKEDIIQNKLQQRGGHCGLVHIISAMETCTTYKPWHDKTTGRTFLKYDITKCLHYYFYFIDELLGLCYVKVPTYCPFPLQIYFNGHNWLAQQMKKTGIAFTTLDNAFDYIEYPAKAQALADTMDIKKIHEKLDEYAFKFCPVYKAFNQRYHYSVAQIEYATDIVFNHQDQLKGLYQELIATAIHTVTPDNIATFLGTKLDPRYQGEVGNRYNIRIEGSRIRHQMGKSAIKMYDKMNKILRIETTTIDITFFKHYRKVEHRDGTTSNKIAPLKKNIYSLPLLQQNLQAANKRYLEFISAFENKEVGTKRLKQITAPKNIKDRNYQGFNFFSQTDLDLLQCIARGEFNINGLRNKDLRQYIKANSNKVSRLLKRLFAHGLIKKAQSSYKYYLTKLGKQAIIMAEKIKELILIPAFNY
ncbi:MAG TPA: hypothetical protein VIL78_03215 [Hanamia sp.]